MTPGLAVAYLIMIVFLTLLTFPNLRKRLNDFAEINEKESKASHKEFKEYINELIEKKFIKLEIDEFF